jgi:hypothetical protein
VISSSSLDEIVSRIKAGDGLRAYREIVGQYPWHGESDAMISIELIEDRHVEVAQQGAAAEAPERARS